MSSQRQTNVSPSQTPSSTSASSIEELRSPMQLVNALEAVPDQMSNQKQESPALCQELLTRYLSGQVPRLWRWGGILPALEDLNIVGLHDMLPHRPPHAPTNRAVEPVKPSKRRESHINTFADDPPFRYERMETRGDLLLTQNDTALGGEERIVGRERMRRREAEVEGNRRLRRD